MPDLWFVPVVGADPARVRLEHVHAAFSRWFDRSQAEHAANDKPYTVSPLRSDERGRVGVEIATLTGEARAQLFAAATDGAQVRLGNQIRAVGRPLALAGRSWAQLAGFAQDRRWLLEFVTPVTFRSGDRSSPLPRVDTIMDGLAAAWSRWSDTPLALPRQPGAETVDARDAVVRSARWTAVWVSDLELHSVPVNLRLRTGDGGVRPVTLSGAMGSMTLRCDDPEAAAQAGPLLRSAAFCGVGGMTGKGFGVTRVRAYPDRVPVAAAVAGGHDRESGAHGMADGDGTSR